MTHEVVHRRHVFFLGGFDPKGASWYHALYRVQAGMQARVSGVHCEVGPREKRPDGNASWSLRSSPGGVDVLTTYEYFRWDDIVRKHWPRTARAVFTATLATYWTILRSGQLGKVRRAAPRTLIPLVFPALFWCLVLVAAMVCAAAAVALAGHGAWAVLAALLFAAGVVSAAAVWERRLNTTWLLRVYRFADLRARGRVAELEPRLDALARNMEAQLRDPQVDEVLLVGFSVGSVLAVSAAARTIQHSGVDNAKLGVVTLGHCIPLLGLMPVAARFREELRVIASAPHLTWIDFSSPSDWGSFALVDPVALCLQEPGTRARPPVLASPRFHTLFPPERYRELRRDKRRMHLQYLMAGELRGDYDYFDLTSGPRSLRARMAGVGGS